MDGTKQTAHQSIPGEAAKKELATKALDESEPSVHTGGRRPTTEPLLEIP